jgi:hypothetical protein
VDSDDSSGFGGYDLLVVSDVDDFDGSRLSWGGRDVGRGKGSEEILELLLFVLSDSFFELKVSNSLGVA